MELLLAPPAAPASFGKVRVSSAEGVGRALADTLQKDTVDPASRLIELRKLETILLSGAANDIHISRPFAFTHVSIEALLRLQTYLTTSGFAWDSCSSEDHLAARVALFARSLTLHKVTDDDLAWFPSAPAAVDVSEEDDNAADDDDEEVADTTAEDFAGEAASLPASQGNNLRFILQAEGEGMVDMVSFSSYEPDGFALYSRLTIWAGDRTFVADRRRGLYALARMLTGRAQQQELLAESKSTMDFDRSAAFLTVAASLRCPTKAMSSSRAVLQDLHLRERFSSGNPALVESALSDSWQQLRLFYPRVATLVAGADQASVVSFVRATAVIFNLTVVTMSLAELDLVESCLADSSTFARVAALEGTAASRVQALRSASSAAEARVAVAASSTSSGGPHAYSTSGTSCAAFSRPHIDALNKLLQRSDVVDLLEAVESASSHLQVVKLVLDARITALFQLLLSTGRAPTSLASLQCITDAHPELSLFLGMAVLPNGGPTENPSSAFFRLDAAAVTALCRGSFAGVNWHHHLVALPHEAMSGVPAPAPPVPMAEALLDGLKRLRLNTAFRKLFSALGFSGDGFPEVLDTLDDLQAAIPDDTFNGNSILKIFNEAEQNISDAYGSVLSGPPTRQLHHTQLWGALASSRSLVENLHEANASVNTIRRSGLVLTNSHLTGPGAGSQGSTTPQRTKQQQQQQQLQQPASARHAQKLRLLGKSPAVFKGGAFSYNGKVWYHTAKLVKMFPAAAKSCLAVVACHDEDAERRLRFCNCANDPSHQVLDSGVHAVVPGLTAIGHVAFEKLAPDFQ
jgi:hypothetical protein